MNRKLDVSSAGLHIIAMFCMLLDHMWATVIPGNNWMTCIGRIAFPIFAFMIVEGYFHTRNFKKYMLRMLTFALVSEIPFDLMYGGTWFYPAHQNVMWTFLIALGGIRIMEWIRSKGKPWLTILGDGAVILLGVILGFATIVDYYGTGILLVFGFYICRLSRHKKWRYYLLQFLLMYWINVELLGGYYYPVTIFGHDFELVQQSFAMLALIPIWLYQGRQGHHSKAFQYCCYGFYPVHMLILSLIGMAM